jgi:hypothetical protein
MEKEFINIPRMKEDLEELTIQINTYYKVISQRNVQPSYIKLMEGIIKRRDLLKQQLTDMGEL